MAAAAVEAPQPPRTSQLRADAALLAYWITLGAAAGGLGGLIAGGIGGRLAMFLLRLTLPDHVRGIESDDGFVIGQFDLVNTLTLLAITAVMGTAVGLVIVLGRPFFPYRRMPLAWTVAGAAVGGGLFIHTDGVDFNLLEPTWLAVALFIAIPAAGGGLIAWLVEVYHTHFWWRHRGVTTLAAIPALMAFAFPPVAVVAAVVGAGWLVALRVERLRELHRWIPARVAAWAVFGIVVAVGLAKVTSDTRELLL
jgi:hypothetical protein